MFCQRTGDWRLRRAAPFRFGAVGMLGLFWLVRVASALGASENSQVDRLLSKWDRPDVPGCAVGVVRDGKLIYAKGFGSANLDYDVPNTPETLFEIGSATKSFTCACIALLLDSGKISLDDDVRRYVPELPERETPIRIRHLIQCRSGLWEHWHLVQLAGWSSEPIQAPYTDQDLLTLLAGQKTLPFEPGTQFRYSGSDYFLLGVIIDRATGKTLAEFAHDNLFEPLGMMRTYYEQNPAVIVKNRAVGYYRDERRNKSAWRSWTSQAAGAGGWDLKTCVADLARWEGNFLDNRLGRGQYFNEFLKEGTLLGNRNVLDVTPTGSYRGLQRIQFTGGMPGYLAAFTRFPDQRVAVIFLSNNSSEINPWETSEKIADIYLADNLEPEAEPSPPAGGPIAPPELSVDQLRDKIGAYRGESGGIWRVTFKDGKLWLTDRLNDDYELRPLSDTRFQADPFPDATLEFNRPAADKPFTLTLEGADGTTPLSRVELVDPSSAELEEYAGDYHSGELAITYRIAIKQGALWLRVGARGWEQLDATVHDEFVPHMRRPFDNRIFAFQRDETGRVAVLRVALWRVAGVRFDRQ